jgi:hypothetical protein
MEPNTIANTFWPPARDSAELRPDLIRLIARSAGKDADFALDFLRTDAHAKHIKSSCGDRYGDFEADPVAGEVQHRHFEAVVGVGRGRGREPRLADVGSSAAATTITIAYIGFSPGRRYGGSCGAHANFIDSDARWFNGSARFRHLSDWL